MSKAVAVPKQKVPPPVGIDVSQVTDVEDPVFYSSFTFDQETYQTCDVVFLNPLTYEEKVEDDEKLRNYWIGVIDVIFVERDSPEDVQIGVRWFYRKNDVDLEDINSRLPSDFMRHCDEVIFSDHMDVNAATVVRGHCKVHMCLDTVSDPVPKLNRDQMEFCCRLAWFTKSRLLTSLSRALTLDGLATKRALTIARTLTMRSLGALVAPRPYPDCEDYVGQKLSISKRNQSKNGRATRSVGETLAMADELASNHRSNRKRKTTNKSSGSNKKSKSTRLPTFEETKQLVVTRGEAYYLNKSSDFSVVAGGFALLKHKNEENKPVTTLYEIVDVPEDHMPYRPYTVTFKDASGKTVKFEGCVGGLQLLMPDGTISRRSIVNLRDRPLEKADYDLWLKRMNSFPSNAMFESHYPSTASEIASRVSKLNSARKKHTRDKVRSND